MYERRKNIEVPIEDSKVVFDFKDRDKMNKGAYPSEIRERISTIKNFSYGSSLKDKSRYTTRGMFAGAMAGMAYAFFKKKNILAGIFFGSAIGMSVGYVAGEINTNKEIDKNKQQGTNQ